MSRRESVIRAWEGELLPDHLEVERILATEEVPWGTGTGSRRCYSLLVSDTRYWLSDDEIRAAGVLPQDENTPPQGEDVSATERAEASGG